MRDEIQKHSMAASHAAPIITEDETQRSTGVDTTACCREILVQGTRFDHSDQYSAAELTIKGMHCGSCVDRVKTALITLDGVTDASIDIVSRKATVRYNPSFVDIEDFKSAVASAGYEIAVNEPEDVKAALRCCEQPIARSNRRAYVLGVLASFAIVGIYLGMNTLTSDWYFARVQFLEYRWWIFSLAIGLGIQVALFILYRGHHSGQQNTAANSSMAASGGVSVVAMMACCSHYLATVVPLLGVSFLSAAAVASLAQYQPYFFLTGIVSCLFGIGFMVRMMRKRGMFRTGVPKSLMRISSGRVGNV